jgi:hypothetical protein
LTNGSEKEASMASEFNEIGHEDSIDREVRKLVHEMQEEERFRRAVIDVLVMLGDDAALEHDL